jgi:PhoPQ-activated pathogenicity-related protein
MFVFKFLLNFWKASFSGAVSISLEQIPNGRMRFKDWNDGNSGLSGDSLIGYTWRRFLETGGTEHERLLLMPMAKAAVLAFNATSDILQQVQCGRGLSKYPCRKAPLEKYMPWGYSKRGWTAWLTAAVDYKRVAAVNPIVLSFLNMIPNFHHYWRAFGGWSFAMSPYYQQNITKTLDDDLNIEAAKILDPFTFKDRLIMPKLVISAAGDEFFMADDTHYWLKDMKGPTYFRLLPNAEHATVLHRRNTKTMYFTMRQFFLSSMLDLPMPDYCTTRYTRNDGRRGLRIQTNDVLRGLDAFIVDSRDKSRCNFLELLLKIL